MADRKLNGDSPAESVLDALHVTIGHRPDDTRIFLKECRSLVSSGYRVGLLAPGAANSVVHGVTLMALPVATERWHRLLVLPAIAFWRCRKSRARVFHLHDAGLLPVAFFLRLLGRRVIYDAHEDTGKQVMTKPWVPRMLRPLIGRFISSVESGAGRVLAAVVAATPAIAERFPARRTYVVRNLPLPDEIGAEARRRDQRSPLCAYVGMLNDQRGGREMLRALERVTTPGTRLVVAGPVTRAIEHAVEQASRREQVSLVGWLGRDEVRRLLDEASVGLLLFHPAPNHDFALPTKLFEYMAAGLPVVASDLPAWREIVDSEGCGVLVDPLDADAVAAAIDYLLAHPNEALAMGERGRQAILARYNWSSEAGVLTDLYRRLLG